MSEDCGHIYHPSGPALTHHLDQLRASLAGWVRDFPDSAKEELPLILPPVGVLIDRDDPVTDRGDPILDLTWQWTSRTVLVAAHMAGCMAEGLRVAHGEVFERWSTLGYPEVGSLLSRCVIRIPFQTLERPLFERVAGSFDAVERLCVCDEIAASARAMRFDDASWRALGS
jgi:hypothetical protein